jgi:hypothetical protein
MILVMAGRGDEALLRADDPTIHVFGEQPSSKTWIACWHAHC